MKLTIEHDPVAKTRPRMSMFRGKARVYDIQSSIMRKIKTVFKSQMIAKGYLKLEEGPVMIKMTAYMLIPKTSAKKSLEMEGQPQCKKPDVDNIFKLYSDCLNGIAFRDDGQICTMLCEKLYSSTPRVEIVVEQFNRLRVRYLYRMDDDVERDKPGKSQCW